MSFADSSGVSRYVRLWEKFGNKDKKMVETVEEQSSEVKIGKMDLGIEYRTRSEVIEFVPAFFDRYRQGERLKPSIAVKPVWDQWDDDESDDISLEPELTESKEKRIYQELGPVGYKFKTDIMKFDFNREKIDEKFEHNELTPQSKIVKDYVGFLYSFQATHALAVITELEVELDDLYYTWEITDDSIISYIYDVFEGGSGVTKKIYLDWMGPQKTINKKIRRLLYPPENEFCCRHVCEKCILLPRTPEFLLSTGLLDKDFVRKLYE